MEELTRLFVILAEQKDPSSVELFLSIVSNWQDYTDEERVEYINSLDKQSALLLQQIGAAGVNNGFSFLVIISQGILPRTMYQFLGLLSMRLMMNMELVNTTMLLIFNQTMNFIAYTDNRRN